MNPMVARVQQSMGAAYPRGFPPGGMMGAMQGMVWPRGPSIMAAAGGMQADPRFYAALQRQQQQQQQQMQMAAAQHHHQQMQMAAAAAGGGRGMPHAPGAGGGVPAMGDSASLVLGGPATGDAVAEIHLPSLDDDLPGAGSKRAREGEA